MDIFWINIDCITQNSLHIPEYSFELIMKCYDRNTLIICYIMMVRQVMSMLGKKTQTQPKIKRRNN